MKQRCPKMKWKHFVLLIFLVLMPTVAEGLRCYDCSNIFDPRFCTNVVTCNRSLDQDSCFIEEVTNDHGNNGYHMGCENTKACQFRSSSVPIGRRQLTRVHDMVTTCYKCCQGNLCNAEFCAELCPSSPCLNGGKCTAMRHSQDYTCSCPPGFTGKNCQTDIDECAKGPCLNGGLCNDLPNSYTCLCTIRYTGANCETAIARNRSVCASCENVLYPQDCKNHVTCEDSEECYIDAFPINGKLQYNLGCRKQPLCKIEEDLVQQNRSTRQLRPGTVCFRCCKADLCNLKTCLDVTAFPQESCQAYQKLGFTDSGIFVLDLGDGQPRFSVYCDMTTAGGGWVIFQRRQDGSVDFYRDWQSYKDGFGNVTAEFWLGNDEISRLTARGSRELRVDLGDWRNARSYAHYDSFSLGSEGDLYQLRVSSYIGTAGDSLLAHSNRPFSTFDRNHNLTQTVNCAETYLGAWWYHDCHDSNLNGHYYPGGGVSPAGKGIVWSSWHNNDYSLKFSEMKLR